MSEPTEKSTKDMGSWAGAATLAGAAIGSAALAAALLFASRRKGRKGESTANPDHAPETD